MVDACDVRGAARAEETAGTSKNRTASVGTVSEVMQIGAEAKRAENGAERSEAMLNSSIGARSETCDARGSARARESGETLVNRPRGCGTLSEVVPNVAEAMRGASGVEACGALLNETRDDAYELGECRTKRAASKTSVMG
jgi:hypothetical protein